MFLLMPGLAARNKSRWRVKGVILLRSRRLHAAHRMLPFGTRLKVINPRNGKAVLVRIHDCGPFVNGVTLDLSCGAAHAIGLQGTGAVCMAMM